MTSFVSDEKHVTVLPPPLPEPTHWFTVAGAAELCVEGSTVHWTRIVPPPPLPDPLHCVTTAPVVLPTGLHDSVGWVPPPSAELLH
jgi:hypothetical protein